MSRIALALFTILVSAIHVHAQSGGPVQQAKAELSPLDQPLAWMAEAKRNFGVVKDYQCTLVSQERVKGVLGEQNIIEFKSKQEPFSVYMRWLGPEKFKSQEVAFVAGKNNNKMRVKSNFIGSNIVGFVTIDTNDARVLQHSRHTILEAGLGNMIEQNIKYWQIPKCRETKVTVGESNTTPNSIRVEITALDQAGNCVRTVVCLEKESNSVLEITTSRAGAICWRCSATSACGSTRGGDEFNK